MLHSLAFFWTDFDNVRLTNLKDFSIAFLARDHIIKMLTRYMILNDTDKLLMVMRPYQVYAVEALVRQATLTNRNAYVWHTTGAGKTLTSFKTAQILAANPNIKKVIFLVDRKDLDSQTTEEFNKFENGSVDATDRTDVLVKQMQDKNRQLIVTTMQKMANAVKRPQYAKIMDAIKMKKSFSSSTNAIEVSSAICTKILCGISRKHSSLALLERLVLRSTEKSKEKSRRLQKCCSESASITT